MLNILGMIILIIILFIIILLIIGIKISLNYDKNGSELKGCLKILIFKKIKVYSITFPSDDDEIDENEDEENEPKKRDIKKLFELAKPCFNDFKIYLKSVSIINPMHKSLRLSAEPSFSGSRLDGRGTNEVEIYPLKLLVPTIRLISKKDVRTFIRGVWDER